MGNLVMANQISFYVEASKLRLLQDCVKGSGCRFESNPLPFNGRAYVYISGDVSDLNVFESRWHQLTMPIVEVQRKKGVIEKLRASLAHRWPFRQSR
jgi:hypothetical protein